MTVECPACKTRFPVDPRKVPPEGVFARCSTCKEVFFVSVSPPQAEVQPPAAEALAGTTPSQAEAPVEAPPQDSAVEAPPQDPDVQMPPQDSGTWPEEAAEEEEGGGDLPAGEPQGEFESGGEAGPEEGPPSPDYPYQEADVPVPEHGGSEEDVAGSGHFEEDVEAGGEEVQYETEVPEDAVSETGSEEGFEAPESEPEGEFEAAEPEPVDEFEAGEPEPEDQFGAAEPEPATPDTSFEEQIFASPPQFGKRDPGEKAQRLARVLVSDIILYNPDRHQSALENDRLKEEFEEEIDKSWNEYVEQVGEELAGSTSHFKDALNEILAKGNQIF